MISSCPARLGLVALVAAAASLAGHGATFGQGAAKSVNLAPHVAIYDLTLKSSRGKRSLELVRGRIVYDFSGSSCEGYALQFRQVTELDSGEGKVAPERPAHHHLGRGRWQELSLQVAELHGPAADRRGGWKRRSREEQRGRQAEQARGQEVRRGHRGVSDRAHAAADRSRRSRQATPRSGRLRWLRVRARRSIIRCR